MKKFCDFVLYSNIFISFCATLMSLETFILLNIKVNFQSTFPLIPIIFLSTLFVYNLDLFGVNASLHQGRSERQIWRLSNIKKIFFFNIILVFLIGLLSLFASLNSFLFFAHLAIISIAYYLSFKIGSAKFVSLRSVPFLKAFIITYVWTASTVLLPALKNQAGLLSNIEVQRVFIERYLFLFALAIIFDIRDLKADEKNILTIPAAVGIAGTKAISFSLLALNVFFVGIHYDDLKILIPLLASTFLTALFIYRAHACSGEYYFVGLLDGAMALQFFGIFIFAWVF